MLAAKRSVRAFTLIELLVVIAIIAILASILFPVFARVREKGRQTLCTSNLSQLAKANRMYMQDWDDYFLPRPAKGDLYWRPLLLPYLKSERVFECPSDDGVPYAEWQAYLKGDSCYNYYGTSYWYNIGLWGREESEVLAWDDPTDVLLNIEIWLWHNNNQKIHQMHRAEPARAWSFLDGHAKFMPENYVHENTTAAKPPRPHWPWTPGS